MSHSVTASKTTLNTKYSNLNSSVTTYLTLPVLFKAVEVVVGIVCGWIATQDFLNNFQDLAPLSAGVVIEHTSVTWGHLMNALKGILRMVPDHDNIFVDQMTCRIIFLTIVSIFLIISLIQITWFPASLFTGPIKSRIISGVVFHLIGFGLHLVASLNLIARIDFMDGRFINEDMMQTVAIIGLVNAGLYLFSSILALWSFVESKICGSKSSARSSHVISTQSVPKMLPAKA